MTTMPRLILTLLAVTLIALPASAASRIISAGQTVGIGEEIVLAGDDVLEVNGTADKPCRLDANTQQIRSAPGWRGHVKIRHCELRSFGSAKKSAIDLVADGDGDRI